MIRGARYLYAALAWAFVAGILLQVYFVGLGIFAGKENLDLHASFGWILHLGPLPVLVIAALARAGRARILQATALAVTIFFVPILAAVRADLPLLAAIHPVGALVAFWLAILVARGATSLAGTSDADTRTPVRDWVLVALVVLIVLVLSFSGSPNS